MSKPVMTDTGSKAQARCDCDGCHRIAAQCWTCSAAHGHVVDFMTNSIVDALNMRECRANGHDVREVSR